MNSITTSHLGTEISFGDNAKAKLPEEVIQGHAVLACPISVSKLHIVCSRLFEVLIAQQQTYPSHWPVHTVHLKSSGSMGMNAGTASNVKGDVNQRNTTGLIKRPSVLHQRFLLLFVKTQTFESHKNRTMNAAILCPVCISEVTYKENVWQKYNKDIMSQPLCGLHW